VQIGQVGWFGEVGVGSDMCRSTLAEMPQLTDGGDMEHPKTTGAALATLRPPPSLVGNGRTGQPPIPVLVRDLMTTAPITVEPAATVQDIAHVLLQHDIRCAFVVDIGDVLVGVVSEVDVICREAYPTVRSHHPAALIDEAVAEHRHQWKARAGGLTAGEIMTTDMITCGPAEPVALVVRRMLHHSLRTLPVIENGHLVGVLSRHDILPLFDRPDSEIWASITDLLADPLRAPDDHAVKVQVLDGVAILTGSVLYPSDEAVVCDLVRQVPGVIKVVVRLIPRKAEPKLSYLHDTDWR
jgi:CBS domain-containing protein